MKDFINQVLNPIHGKSPELLKLYLQLHAVVYYWEYATVAVSLQMRALEEQAPDAVVCSSAISAYGFLKAAIDLLRAAATRTPAEAILEARTDLLDRVKDLRDRAASHPNEDRTKGESEREWFVMSKRTGYNTDGRVWIRQISIRSPTDSRTLALHPVSDLREFEELLEETVSGFQSHVLATNAT